MEKYSNQRYAVNWQWKISRKYQIFAQNRDFCLPHMHSTPALGGFPSEYRHPVWQEKLEWLGYPMVKKIRRYLYSFWRNSRTCQTDRQTDGHRMTTIAALMHSIARQKSSPGNLRMSGSGLCARNL